MIIRITANDNDYRRIIEPFVKDLYAYTSGLKSELFLKDHFDKVNKLLNPNINTKLQEKDKEFLIQAIKTAFKEYLNYRGIAKDISEYLLSNFEVKFLKSFTDKWENGEVFYWLQHSQVVVNQ